MNIDIEVIDTTKVTVPKPNGSSYEKLVVTHKTLSDGKIGAKQLMDFGTPKDVYQRLASAKQGETFNVEIEKSDKGYWEWRKLHTQVAAVNGAAAPAVINNGVSKPAYNPSPNRDFESKDERTLKQRLIVRQSSLTTALKFMEMAGVEPTEENLFGVADRFVNYVYATKGKTDGGIGDMDDDIPF